MRDSFFLLHPTSARYLTLLGIDMELSRALRPLSNAECLCTLHEIRPTYSQRHHMMIPTFYANSMKAIPNKRAHR